MTETLQPKVHDYLEHPFVTDTQVYLVTKVTDKTITVVTTKDGENKWIDRRGGPYPCVYQEVVADPQGLEKVLRRRKDGTFRIANYCNPLRPATTIMGKPVEYTDYRM